MKQLRLLAIAMILTLGVSQNIAAQSFDCPTVEHRHNGNGQSQMLDSYYYSGSASNLPPAAEYEGQITLLFSSMPTVVPYISAVRYNGNVTATVVGPPSTIQQTSTGYRIKYDLYYSNLPANNANYSLDFNAPNAAGTGAGSFLKRCDYLGNGSLNTPSNPSNATVPVITSQPTSISNCGGNGTFTVTATATGTLSYQWRKSGVNITGATSNSYTTNVEGSYDVVVSTSAGSVTSNSVTLSGDHTNPSVATQNVTVALVGGSASVAAADVNNGSTDNCSIASMTLDKSSFTCADLGVNNVVLTVTDASGNFSSAPATVTVVDRTNPTVITRTVTVTLVNGGATITALDVNNGSSDNCSIASMTLDKTSFNCDNIGNNTVTLTVTDGSGNSASGFATIVVVGAIPATPSLSFAAAASSQNTFDNTPNKLYLGYGAQSGTITVTNPAGNTFGWAGQYLSGTAPANRTFAPFAGGTYTTSVIATNSYGCVSPAGNISICVLDIRVPGGSPTNQKVYICHLPPGNVANVQTLSVSISAVPAHVGLHGGDKLGTCGQVCGLNKTTSSIDVIEGEIHMHILPNPVISVPSVMIESTLGDVAQIQIVDLQGKVVFTGNVATNQTVSLDKAFETGLYFINATVEGISVQTKMLVQ